MFVCVGGWETLFVPEDPPFRHLYFRRIQLQRYTTALSGLDTIFTSKEEPKRAWEALNVDVDSLTSLRQRVLKEQHLSIAEVQADIVIEGTGPGPGLLDCESEQAEALGIYRGICAVAQHNMPTECTSITKLLVGVVGKNKAERCRFKLKGDWFWAPQAAHEILKDYVGRSNVLVRVRWGEQGFECLTEETAAVVCPNGPVAVDAAAAPPRKHFVGQPAASEAIPVHIQPQSIKGICFRKAKGTMLSSYVEVDAGHFWLPHSLTDRIIAKLQTECGMSISGACVDVQFDVLNSFFLLRQEGRNIRVSGYSNSEQLVSITDHSGEPVVCQPETDQSRRKRGLEPLFCVSKRQRVAAAAVS